MTTENSEQASGWTWADQVSSWRFWALLISYILSVPLAGVALNMSYGLLGSVEGISLSTISSLLSNSYLATGFGFCLAWIAIKWRPVIFLVFLACLKVCGLIIIFKSLTPLTMGLGFVLVGLTTGAITLTVPAIIAGGHRSTEAFVVSFGVVITFGMVVSQAANYGLQGYLNGEENVNSLLYIAAIPVALSALIFLTAKGELFAGQPPKRGYSLQPRARHPIAVAFLFFVPFYALYWLYRVHGEVAAVAPSRALLSPRASVFSIIFIPLLALVAMASLIDALNNKAQANGHTRFRSPITIFVWAIFFSPVAGAMIQSSINKLQNQ